MDTIERRTVLLGAVGGTLLAMADANEVSAKVPALHVSKPTVNFAGKTVDLFAISDVPLDKAKEALSWKELLGRVTVADNQLKSFDNSFEKGVIKDLKTIKSEEKNGLTHNPRLVEPLLGEIASLIDRCITYRREGGELEISGVAAGAARLTYDALRDIDRQIPSIDLVGAAAGILSKEYPDAIAAYQDATDKKLGAGNATQIQAQVDANKCIASASEERMKLILSRLAFTQEMDRNLLGRHDVSGNAHNYVERFERLRKLFESDIKAAYRRALAASIGLASVFDLIDKDDFKVTVPELSESGFIDDLLIWTRNAIRAVTRIGEVELELSRAVAVSVPAVSAGGPVASFTFKLDDSFFGLKSVRLRSVAASYCLDPGDFKNDNNGNGMLGLALTKTDSKIGPRVVIVNPQVRQWGSQSSPTLVDGALVYNLDPRGTWSGRLSAKGIAGNGSSWERLALIKSLILQFRVIAVPDQSLDGSYWIAEDRV